MQSISVTREIGGRTLTIGTGSYARLADGAVSVQYGDSVVFGFRIQAFVTRAYTAGISGLATGSPRVGGIWAAGGQPVSWPA